MGYPQQYGPSQHGMQPPRKKRNPVLLGCGIAAGIAVLLFGGCAIVLGVAANKASKTTPPPAATQSEKGGPAKTKAELPRLGQPATGHGVQLTALRVIAHPADSPIATAAKGHRVAVQVKVKNVSGKPLSVNPLYFKAIGSDDQEYSLDLGNVDGQIDTTELAPGIAKVGLVGFDLPKGVSPVKLTFTDPLFSDAVTTGLTK
jgi:hypothetical protein